MFHLRTLTALTLTLSGALFLSACLLFARTPKRPDHPENSAQFGQLHVATHTRTFVYYAPSRVSARAPLLIAYHGSRESGQKFRLRTGFAFDRLADAHGFVVVYPDGIRRSWNDCRKAASYAARRLDIDDVAFTRALIARFQRSHSIDPERVFALGFSSGGQMSFRLALEASDTVRAIAVISASLPTPANLDCTESAHGLPVMVMNGTDDHFNPFEGGLVTVFGFGSRGDVRSSLDTAHYFAALQGTSASPTVEMLTRADTSPWVERATWSAPGSGEVSLVTIHGGGHVVPQTVSRYPKFLGATASGFDGPHEIWRFFQRELARTP